MAATLIFLVATIVMCSPPSSDGDEQREERKTIIAWKESILAPIFLGINTSPVSSGANPKDRNTAENVGGQMRDLQELSEMRRRARNMCVQLRSMEGQQGYVFCEV